MPSAKKLQAFLQQGDLSQSDQQQLARSIADLKKKRAQKRTARVASLPFEIHVHSWYYYSNRTEHSKEDVEKQYHIPRTLNHTFVQRPRLTRISSSKIGPNNYYKYHIDAVIRCPDFASTKQVWRIFANHSYYPIKNSLSRHQIYLNYPTHPKLANGWGSDNWTQVAIQQLGIDTTKNGYMQKIWRYFNPNETSRIWVTYKDEIIYDNNDSNKKELTDGFLNIVGRFMETSSALGFRTTASGQLIS